MLRDPKRRSAGRPPTLDIGGIVAAAVCEIDEAGLEGCTMRALAVRLGVTPMSIYRHVADKDDLLRQIPDSMLVGVAADVRRRRRAVPSLRAVADGLAAILESHPNVAPLFHQPVPGHNMIAAAEHCIALLVSEGCPPSRAFEVIRALVALVVGQAVTSHGARDDLGVRIFLTGVDSLLVGPSGAASATRFR
jgi:TetR/AcrR family tetracycline transcriptional repressor